MVSVLVWSAVVCEFEPWSGQIKHNIVSICCFSSKHTALSSNKKTLSFLFFVVLLFYYYPVIRGVRIEIPLTGLTPPLYCDCPMPGFPPAYVMVFLCSMI